MGDLEYPLNKSPPDAVERPLHLWDALQGLERRRDEAAGAAREGYAEAVSLFRDAWAMLRNNAEAGT